jgi:hypothetical protein
MPKLVLPALAAGFLALSAAAATAAPTVRPAIQPEGVSAPVLKADWDDHCGWRCREWRHRRWEHERWERERWEARRRWEHRHEWWGYRY